MFWSLLEIGLNEEIYKMPCKIDTGCSYSNLPIKNIVSEKVAYNMKLNDIKNKIPYQRSYGVSDTEETKRKDNVLITQGRLLECTSLKFEHKFDNIILNNYCLGIQSIRINYDRTGSILIGMDILSQMDIHMGTDKNTGEYILIGCLKDNINMEYKEALRTSTTFFNSSYTKHSLFVSLPRCRQSP